MDPQTVREKFQNDVDFLRESALCKAFGWKIEIHPDEFLAYVFMSPRKARDKRYLLQIGYDDYPQRAPSCIFVDVGTKQETDAAWPPRIKHSGPPPGICAPGTRAFHERLHKNEPAYQWNAEKFKVTNTLQNIQILIDRPK